VLSDKNRIRVGDLVRVKPTWSIDYLRQSNTDMEGQLGVVTRVIPHLGPTTADDSDPLNDMYEVLMGGEHITFYGMRFLEVATDCGEEDI
jgi:hypothetical protein